MSGESPWDKGLAAPEAEAGSGRADVDPHELPGDAAGEALPGPPAQGGFVGRRWRLLGMALRLGLWTVLTLGFYRFWMKTRLRRWYWSGVRIGGHGLEYVGDPLEKLLGFLIAVVILAFYIGVVNLILMFASFSIFHGNFSAYLLSFLGVIPLWFYARYRARRYVLARTRWRGIRFGLAPGAWGYARRALWHWALTLLTLGLLWPRKTFWLEKYRTDRTWYGSTRFEQGGTWRMLFRPFLQVVVPGAGLAGAVAWMAVTGRVEGWPLGAAALLVPWMGLGMIHYRVQALKLLTNTKRLGGVTLEAAPRSLRVMRIYLLGYGLAGLVGMAILVPVALAVAMAAAATEFGAGGTALAELPPWALAGLGVVSYFAFFLSWSALGHALVTMPLWQHYAGTLRLHGTAALDGITQRPRDAFEEAEGFAEALDVGAAI